MKNILMILAMFVVLSSCTQTSKNSAENKSSVLSVPELIKEASTILDKEVKLTGTVEHVCSHSGRRCFLIDSIADKSIRVEATGEIESFGKELLGLDIIVSGIVREEQLKAAEIDEWEQSLITEYGDIENGGEKCAAEMGNIKNMREWMKENGKDYYAIYFVDGLNYEVVE